MKSRWLYSVLLVALVGARGWAQEKAPEPPQAPDEVEEEAQGRGQPQDLIEGVGDGGKAGKNAEPEKPLTPEEVWSNFVKNWKGFLNWALLIEVCVALVLAVILGACIAYHPRSYGKASTLDEVDQPKIFIMYALVGSLVAQIVVAVPAMSLVIFGIGGLFRFRTDVGPARDTGRLIMVTCIGLCCGMGIYMVAIFATVFVWCLIYYLEGKVAHKVVIKGIEPSVVQQAADAYREVLVENGLNVISEKKNIVKKQVAFVFRAPGELDREAMEGLFKDIPPKLQGAVDWESS